jgi:hypothetical protein
MKSHRLGFLFLTFLVLSGAASVAVAQQPASAAVEAQQLRNELSQLLDREAEIKMRLQQLDYELQPENIQRFFAGVGSTRPEELRENRRRNLQAEKDRLQQQLNEISQDRPKLDAAILNAESRAYQEAAMAQNRMSPVAGLLARMDRRVAGVVVVLILGGVVVALLRRSRSQRKR